MAVYEGGGGIEIDGNTSLTSTDWHHIVYTKTDVFLGTLYVDGVVEGTHTANYTLKSTDIWTLGQEWDQSGPSQFFYGYLDDAAVWSTALSSAEVSALYSGGNGLDARSDGGNYTSSGYLEGYWKMIEGTGSTLTDSSGNGNSGIIVGASWRTDVPFN